MSGVCAAMCEPLLAWYDACRRELPWRADPTPYHVWISEIMLQQTRVQAVLGYYERWMHALPTLSSLAQASEALCLKLWEGLGYYSRVRNLRRAAIVVAEQLGGELPADYSQLLQLPGIGAYTAGAIASIAFHIPVAAVDGNVLRVAARLDGDYTPIDQPRYKSQIQTRMNAIIPHNRPGDFNQALMELGATICLPNGVPLCGDCPVAHLCAAFHTGETALLPQRKPKKARRAEPRTVLLPWWDGRVGIRRRPAHGLLAGLWELPSLDDHLSPAQLEQTLQAQGWEIRRLLSLPSATHIFTHVEWHMTGYHIDLHTPPDGLTFVTPQELRHSYALPSAFRTFLSTMEDEQL